MEDTQQAARRANALALASLVRTLAGMLLAAGMLLLLVTGYVLYRDRQTRRAMGQAVATVTGHYVHGEAVYVSFTVDDAAQEGLLTCTEPLPAVGSQLPILYDREHTESVRTDTPPKGPQLWFRIAAMAVVLSLLSLLGQLYLKIRDENPWQAP